MQHRYDEAIAFLLGRIDYERALRMPYRRSTLKLPRMRELLERLSNPQSSLRIVHVAGTKGKGSTSLMLEGILHAAGHRVGCFTSPHLVRLEERFRLDRQPCTTGRFVELVQRLKQAVVPMDEQASRRGWAGPTYFELTTALALMLFAESVVDYAILEVGLGGRLDSTNVCHPQVSVITSISRDHMKQLGNTLGEIAREKAGIIKPSVPVVSGVTNEEPRRVIAQVAQQQGAPLDQLGQHFGVRASTIPAERHAPGSAFDYWTTDATGAVRVFEQVQLGVLGAHQQHNAALAWRVTERLERLGGTFDEHARRRGLRDTQLPARVELVGRSPTIIIDTAHNVASITALIETLRNQFQPLRRRLLLATTQEKEIAAMLTPLVDYFDEIVCSEYGSNPRALPAAALFAVAKGRRRESGAGPQITIDEDPQRAWTHLRQSASADDLLCITGSFFIAAELRDRVLTGS